MLVISLVSVFSLTVIKLFFTSRFSHISKSSRPYPTRNIFVLLNLKLCAVCNICGNFVPETVTVLSENSKFPADDRVTRGDLLNENTRGRANRMLAEQHAPNSFKPDGQSAFKRPLLLLFFVRNTDVGFTTSIGFASINHALRINAL